MDNDLFRSQGSAELQRAARGAIRNLCRSGAPAAFLSVSYFCQFMIMWIMWFFFIFYIILIYFLSVQNWLRSKTLVALIAAIDSQACRQKLLVCCFENLKNLRTEGVSYGTNSSNSQCCRCNFTKCSPFLFPFGQEFSQATFYPSVTTECIHLRQMPWGSSTFLRFSFSSFFAFRATLNTGEPCGDFWVGGPSPEKRDMIVESAA